jgi:hypothetical protein
MKKDENASRRQAPQTVGYGYGDEKSPLVSGIVSPE